MLPEEAYHKMVEAGEKWADLNSAAEVLKSTRESLKSQLILDFLPPAKTIARATAMAEASQRYMDHLHAMAKAGKESNIAKVNYDALRVMIDLQRTAESTRRAELQQLRG
jgi:hypothetical protein